MAKQTLALYFEIDDMAIDQDGNHSPDGMKLSFGEVENLPPYEELTKNIDLDRLIASFPVLNLLEKEQKKGKIHIISPEQYEKLYGDDDASQDDRLTPEHQEPYEELYNDDGTLKGCRLTFEHTGQYEEPHDDDTENNSEYEKET